MKLGWTRICAVSLFCAAWTSAGVLGQEETSSSPKTAGEAQATKVEEMPLLGPKYLNLRYDEDFSYLDGEPGSYNEDFFDPIKNIRLGDDWRLSIGGELRFRLEAETNKAFGATRRAQDTFTLRRYMLHANLKYRKLFRLFAQGVAAFDEDRDLRPRGIDENRWDLQQLFFDVRVLGEDLPLTLRVGRQELQYGAERYVSPLEWANVRRRFDGVKLFAKGDMWDVDLWYVKPVDIAQVQRKQRDRYNEDVDFYGAYATYKGIARHGLDLYFFALDDTGNRINPNGRAGDRDVYTLGSRFWGKTAGFDYEAELAGQWGHWAGDTIQAWSWNLDGGYTFSGVGCKPRLGVGFDWASGDRDPTDGQVQTFDQLFPFSHFYLGFLDLIARQNITALNVNLSAWAVPEKVKTKMTFHTFWLNSKDDWLYNAPGGWVRRDLAGNSGREIGHELDVTVVWKLNPHQAMLFGYSHFWDSDFIQQTGPSENADLLYVQYAYKF